MATTKTSKTSNRSNTGSKTNWMSLARQNKMTIRMSLVDATGKIVTDLPISWGQIPAIGINLRPIEKYVSTNFSEVAGAPGTKLRRSA